MAAEQPSARIVLGRPFNQQVAYFRQKLGNLVPTSRWDDIQREAHDSGFMVAGATKTDLLADLASAVDRAISEGKGLGAFRKDFRDIVERNGWHGWTGEQSRAGRNWRTRVIYRTNAATSYAAGRLAQLRESGFRYWIYRHNDSVRNPRPQHQAWHGLTLPPDDPFWQTHYPPNGWGCQCHVIGAHRETSARRLGSNPDKALPEDWDAIDAKTGAPPGIDQGWDYAPGARVSRTVSAMAEKVRHWDYQLAKGFMQEVPGSVRDRLAISYRNLPSVADDARRYAQRVLRGGEQARSLPPVRTLGLLTEVDSVQVKALKGEDVGLFDFSLDAYAVKHVQDRHGHAEERKRGQQPVTTDTYALLPQLINQGEPFTDSGDSRSTGRPLVMREWNTDGGTLVAVFEVRSKRRTLALTTLYMRSSEDER